MKNNKGFTLVELLAVIVILGVIITIVTLNVGNSLDRSKKKTAMYNPYFLLIQYHSI